jgi:predicted lipid-binding transport protein (Tim44 family)
VPSHPAIGFRAARRRLILYCIADCTWEVDVPLSDNEQRLLEQMERALYAEDPKFASTMRGASRRVGAGRKILIGGVAVALGLVGLVAGVAGANYLLGILGFVLMLAGTAFALSSQRRGGPTGVVSPGGVVKGRPPKRRRNG